MKWWHGLIIGLILAAAICIPSTYYLSRCNVPGGAHADPRPPKPPVLNPDIPNPKYCGDTIDIQGTMKTARLFEVIARNKCMSVQRDFDIIYTCPVRHHEVMILVSGGLLYDNAKIDLGYGGELIYSYSWGRFGVSAGAGFLRFTNAVVGTVHAGAFLRF